MIDDPKVTGSRPIDPSRNAEDLMGEAASSGITTGGAQQTSATPGDTQKDDSDFRGGVLENPTRVPSERMDETEYSDKAYDKQTIAGMSGVSMNQANEQASGEEKKNSKQLLNANRTGEDDELAKMGNETQEDAEKDTTTSEAPFTGVENLGQQDAVGGSESAPETDDDVGEMQERMGLGPDKDGEDPQEVSIADAIDKAEQYHREH